MKERRVVCAALRAEDGEILLGIRHYSADMYEQLRHRTDCEKFFHLSHQDQGFVDQFGVYMTRREAFDVAMQAGQIIDLYACDITSQELYSEGLY